MNYELVLEQGLKQQLSQFQMLSLNILSFDNCELEEFLDKEYEENPLMEYTPEKRVKISQDSAAPQDDSSDYIQRIGHEKGRDIRLYFLEQLNYQEFSKRQWKIISYMVSCVEESGILEISAADIGNILGVGTDECEYCRKILTGLEPAGVFAGSVKESLKLQMGRLGERTETSDLLIDLYLEELSMGHFSKVGKLMHEEAGRIKAVFEIIKGLNPHPLQCISAAKADYVIPDIICRGNEKDYELLLNDDWVANYSLSDYYMNMMSQAEDEPLKNYFRQKYERFQYIIAGIEKRRNTIIGVSDAIIKRQMDYFFKHKTLRPMSMQDIADDIGVNISTVSRAVKGKYIQYLYGTVAVKDLFTGAYSFGDQDGTVQDIKKKIMEIIEREDKAKPYSDQKIVDLLMTENVSVSRRTITKYREEMGIGGTYARRKTI